MAVNINIAGGKVVSSLIIDLDDSHKPRIRITFVDSQRTEHQLLIGSRSGKWTDIAKEHYGDSSIEGGQSVEEAVRAAVNQALPDISSKIIEAVASGELSEEKADSVRSFVADTFDVVFANTPIRAGDRPLVSVREGRPPALERASFD